MSDCRVQSRRVTGEPDSAAAAAAATSHLPRRVLLYGVGERLVAARATQGGKMGDRSTTVGAVRVGNEGEARSFDWPGFFRVSMLSLATGLRSRSAVRELGIWELIRKGPTVLEDSCFYLFLLSSVKTQSYRRVGRLSPFF
jgi:hypothetical protein